VNQVEEAVACFEKGFNCSQAVCSTYAERFGLDRETALKIAAGFGGGMGRMAGTCGVVTGAFTIIGLKYGAIEAEDKEAKEKTYECVREFAKRFVDRNNSVFCKDLLDCDISTPEGHERAKEQELFSTRCPQFVRDAAEILEEMLNM